MKIRLNPDEKVVAMVKEGLAKKDGYCPCRLERTPENKCMCKEFREQIADENFEEYIVSSFLLLIFSSFYLSFCVELYIHHAYLCLCAYPHIGTEQPRT